MPVMEQLQLWGIIAKNNSLKCNNGHFLKLCSHADVTDGFVWRCREYYVKNNKKKVKCDFKQSIRKDTFFDKSHLSIFRIVTFTYLWTENVSLSFIKNQIGIAQQSLVDWASFHREVVFDGLILHHEKIGNIFFSIFKKQIFYSFNYLIHLLRRRYWKNCRDRRVEIWSTKI